MGVDTVLTLVISTPLSASSLTPGGSTVVWSACVVVRHDWVQSRFGEVCLHPWKGIPDICAACKDAGFEQRHPRSSVGDEAELFLVKQQVLWRSGNSSPSASYINENKILCESSRISVTWNLSLLLKQTSKMNLLLPWECYRFYSFLVLQGTSCTCCLLNVGLYQTEQ